MSVSGGKGYRMRSLESPKGGGSITIPSGDPIWISPIVSTGGAASMYFCGAVTANSAVMTVRHYADDGTDVIHAQTFTVTTAGIGVSVNLFTSLVAITLDVGSPGSDTTILWQVSFFDGKPYDEGAREILAGTEDIQVVEAPRDWYTLDVGKRFPAGRDSLVINDSATPSPTSNDPTGNGHTLFGVAAGAGAVGPLFLDNSFFGRAAGFGANSAVGGYSVGFGSYALYDGCGIRNTAIGVESGAGVLSSCNRGSFLGMRSGRYAKSDATTLGYQAGTFGGDRCTLVGAYAGEGVSVAVPTGEDVVCVGYKAGNPLGPSTIADYEVLIGSGCAPSNVTGRLGFGGHMEAPHGSFAMPNSGTPEAYLKMEWNGTLYYIPAFTSVPV